MTEQKLNQKMAETSAVKDEYAEKPEEILNEKELKELKEIEEEVVKKDKKEKVSVIESWEPKTLLGRKVKDKKIKNIDEILDKGEKILEPEIVDSLLSLKSDLILIGQSKGKFGGGKRRAWKQTQRKTEEGNVLKFSAMSVVGDENGHVGIGKGNSVETLPARDKSATNAKLNIFKITRKCAAFDCECGERHTIPFKVSGKSGSVELKLIPAPQGTGLVVNNELKKVLSLAGIKDIYSKTKGQTRTAENLVKACVDALKKTNRKIESKNKFSAEEIQ